MLMSISVKKYKLIVYLEYLSPAVGDRNVSKKSRQGVMLLKLINT